MPIAALACLYLLCGLAQGRVHRSQSWADTQFAKAENLHQALNAKSNQARTRHEYETVITSYRLVVLKAPTSTKADDSAFAVAELTAAIGRRFKDDRALYSAVREYKFLRREYPGSKHRIAALLAIGEIYKNDLGDDADAKPTFEELLRRYPHSDLVKEARGQLANMTPTDALETNADNTATGNTSADLDNASTSEDTSSNGKSEKETRVTDVQYWSGPDYTRVTISLQQGLKFQAERLESPDRIFFDLKNAQLATALLGQSYDVDDGLVKKIRVAQYKPGRARVVVETARHARYTASVVANPPRLVVDVYGVAQRDTIESAATMAKLDPVSDRASDENLPQGQDHSEESCATKSISVTTVAGVKRVVVDADDDDPPDATDESSARAKPLKHVHSGASHIAAAKIHEAQPTSSGGRSLIRALGLKIGKIVIDPGHGGHDTGTIGPNGFYEKDLVLDVSKRLGKLLAARLGADVVYTRRDDTFIPLESRTAIANQEQADLFVSVHANSSHDPDARGVETYYLNFTSSPDALEVAARENADSDKSIHELQDLVKTIALKEKIEESREFASDVQESLHTGLAARNPGERDRGVKKAPFVVLIGANMPSILAEISFISNPGDERRLRTPEYRQRIAESLYRGIARYVNGLGGVKLATRMEKASSD